MYFNASKNLYVFLRFFVEMGLLDWTQAQLSSTQPLGSCYRNLSFVDPQSAIYLSTSMCMTKIFLKVQLQHKIAATTPRRNLTKFTNMKQNVNMGFVFLIRCLIYNFFTNTR